MPSRPLRVSLVPLLLLAGGSTSTCNLSTDAGTGALHLSGTIRFLEAEHGCWQLETGNGRRYELRPGQAPDRVLRDGATVSVRVRPSADSRGVCPSAVPVDVDMVLSVVE